ncbi:pentatricopeptide repeat-containing protein [Tanacetum coccineum]
MMKSRKKRLSLALINRVLIMYLSCGSLDYARKVFDEMSKKDFNSWAIMIAGYADNGEYEEVIKLFVNDKFRYIMYSCVSLPVSWIMVCVLKACGETMNVQLGEQVHGWLMKSGYSDDLFVGSSLISFYGKIGCFEDGDMVFDQIGFRGNVVVWTARIINNCKEERLCEVFEVFNEMGKVGVRKNSFTLSSVLSACSKISDDGNSGEQVHANAIKLGLASKSYVQYGLVNMYGMFGLMNDAKRVFGTNESRRNRACWNAMLLVEMWTLSYRRYLRLSVGLAGKAKGADFGVENLRKGFAFESPVESIVKGLKPLDLNEILARDAPSMSKISLGITGNH